jgi:CRISPR type III-A-associated protein Csm2
MGDQTETKSSDLLERIIAEGNADELVKEAEQLGQKLAAAKVSAASIRNIFESVKRIQMEVEMRGFQSRKLKLLKPKMKYALLRTEKGKEALEELVDSLSCAIEIVDDNPESFEHFVEFFEATLIYHKVHGR